MANVQARPAAVAVAVVIVALLSISKALAADPTVVARGRYLVSVIGCSDCHTPGAMTGKPDMERFLAGSDVGFHLPGLGTFVPPNLTPDKATGLGSWSEQQIVTAFTEGKNPEGRTLAPIMPWRDFANLTEADASAIAAYLTALKPVSNRVPGPFGPSDKVPILVETIVRGSSLSRESTPPSK